MFKHDDYRDIFNQRANGYHLAMQSWPEARNEEFRELLSLAEIETHHSVIDMLSGGGYLSWYLPPQCELYHLETSSVFADFGRSGTTHPIVLVNQHELPFPDASVDRFLSLAGLHHVEDKTPIYREISRVLRPGGIAVIADAHADSNVARFLDTCVHELNPMGHSGIYLSEASKVEIETVGLEVTSSETIDYCWHYSSVGDMTKYCRQIFGMTLGDEQAVRRGIDHHLGYSEEGGTTKMNWNLHFIKMRNRVSRRDAAESPPP